MEQPSLGAPMEAAVVATGAAPKETSKQGSAAAKKTWSAAQVHMLIGIWQEVLVSLSHGNLRGTDMDNITTRYNTLSGDVATKAQVESRIAGLKKTYLNQLRLKGSTGRAPRKTWEFFEEIHGFMGFKPKATGIPGHRDSGIPTASLNAPPTASLTAMPTASRSAPPATPQVSTPPSLPLVSAPPSLPQVSALPSTPQASTPPSTPGVSAPPSTPQVSAPPSTPMLQVSPENSRDEPEDVAAKEIPAAVESRLPKGVEGKRTASGEASAKQAKKSKARRNSVGGSGVAIAKALEGLVSKMDDREERREKQRREDIQADRQFKKDMMRMQIKHQQMMAQILLGGGQQQPINEPDARDDEDSATGSEEDSFADKED